MEARLQNLAGWQADNNSVWQFTAAGDECTSVLWQSATFKGQWLIYNSTRTQRLSLCQFSCSCLWWARLKASVFTDIQWHEQSSCLHRQMHETFLFLLRQTQFMFSWSSFRFSFLPFHQLKAYGLIFRTARDWNISQTCWALIQSTILKPHHKSSTATCWSRLCAKLRLIFKAILLLFRNS